MPILSRQQVNFITSSSKTSKDPSNSAVDPFSLVREIKGRGPAPVHLWDPPFCGDIDMRIAKDGSWFHDGKPIRRAAMVKLFASILKIENGSDYFLVTPVEKVGIVVEDCPFVITQMNVEGVGLDQVIEFITNTDEQVIVDNQHPLSFGQQDAESPHPTVLVRNGLNGLISRSVFYRLVELAVENPEQADSLGVWSKGVFFNLSD